MTNDICWCAARRRPPGSNLVFQQSKFEDQSGRVRQILKGVITQLKKEWARTIEVAGRTDHLIITSFIRFRLREDRRSGALPSAAVEAAARHPHSAFSTVCQ